MAIEQACSSNNPCTQLSMSAIQESDEDLPLNVGGLFFFGAADSAWPVVVLMGTVLWAHNSCCYKEEIWLCCINS
jgi:hypothetical protein